jgi:hypothetical protein
MQFNRNYSSSARKVLHPTNSNCSDGVQLDSYYLIFLDSEKWFQSCQADYWDGSSDKTDTDSDEHGDKTVYDVEKRN